MSKEEIFDEFVKVTHIDKSKIETYYPIINIAIDGEIIADGFEGIIVKLKGKSDLLPITYFHRPYLGERGTL